MKHCFVISGAAFLLLLAAGFALSILAVRDTQGKAEPLRAASVVAGQWASDYEDIYNKSLKSFPTSRSVWGALTYAAFRQGSEGVLVGRDGWLFTTEEFQRQANTPQNFRDNVGYIKEVSAALEARGVGLLVVPVPAKARLYQDYLGAYAYPSYKEPVYRDFLGALQAGNIHAIDMLTPFGRERNGKSKKLFLRTDTHWTPEGAEAAARSVADYIRRHNLAGTPGGDFQTRRVERERFEGDLMRYIPVGPLAEVLDTPEEWVTLYETEAGGGGIQHADLSVALFEDRAPDIALVGTSYSANPKWNFAGFLKQHLQTDVLNAAEEGLGPFETMEKYLSDGAFRESPPRLVIWEIPERYLTFDYDLEMPGHTVGRGA